MPIKVYFLGTGAICLPVLDALLADERIEVVGIGTQPDQPFGRKRCLKPSPVGSYAEEHTLQIDKATSVNSINFINHIQTVQPELILVFCFGQLIKNELLQLPQFGCMNIHVSLLPSYRGASPINAAILAGDQETGICFMKMDKGLDTGDIYHTHIHPLTGAETAPELETILANISGKQVVDIIEKVCREDLHSTPQKTDGVSYAHKIKKEDGLINWGLSASEIERKIRALQPWPRAVTTISTPKSMRLQITKATVITNSDNSSKPGTIIQADKNGWLVACGKNILKLEKLIPAGRREMTAEEFLRGRSVAVASLMGN